MKSKKALAFGVLVSIYSFGVVKVTEASLEDNSPNKQSVLVSSVKAAIERYEQTPKENWAFQVSRYENEEGQISSSIEHYTPNVDVSKQWTVSLINGEAPTPQQINKFVKSKVKEQKRSDQSLSIELRKLIKLDSLTLIKESENILEINFNVQLDRLGSDAKDKLQGRLTLNKQYGFIESIVITNKAEFSPMFSATIRNLELTILFVQINNAILLHQQNLNMKGTFAFFSEIDEVSRDVFSNYRFVSDLKLAGGK